VITSQQIRRGEPSQPLEIRTPVAGLEWLIEGGAARGSVVNGVFQAAPSVEAGEIVKITAREIATGVTAARNVKFHIGILP
jgi:hypothetical protein